MLRISAAVPDSDPEEQTAEECGMERIDYAKSLVAMYQSPPSAASMDNPLCDVVHTKFGPRPVFPSKISVGSELAKLQLA